MVEELCLSPVLRDRSATAVACGDHIAIHLGSLLDIMSARRKRTDIAIIYRKHSSAHICGAEVSDVPPHSLVVVFERTV